VLRTQPGRLTLARALYAAVGRAEHHVYVENPYLSDGRMLYLLARARRRGADVRVVLTLQTGEPVYDRANRVTANRLQAAGVRVYLYPGMTHAKALSVDGLWAYTGSGNFDPLSLRHNREMGLAISGGPAVAEVEARLFLPDFNPVWELTAPLPVSLRDYLAEMVAGTF
jgi:cardiolipin synthase